MVLAVADEYTYRLVCKRELRLQGRCYEVEAYAEVRPDVWPLLRVGPHRATVPPGRRAMRVVGGGTQDEEPPMPCGGFRVKKGHWCQHTVAKCANFRGPHFAQANVCPGKRTARSDAKRWRPPSPTWRQRGKISQPEEPPTGTQETNGGKPEEAVEE